MLLLNLGVLAAMYAGLAALMGTLFGPRAPGHPRERGPDARARVRHPR
jgi:hypothetical protein